MQVYTMGSQKNYSTDVKQTTLNTGMTQQLQTNYNGVILESHAKILFRSRGITDSQWTGGWGYLWIQLAARQWGKLQVIFSVLINNTHKHTLSS